MGNKGRSKQRTRLSRDQIDNFKAHLPTDAVIVGGVSNEEPCNAPLADMDETEHHPDSENECVLLIYDVGRATHLGEICGGGDHYEVMWDVEISPT